MKLLPLMLLPLLALPAAHAVAQSVASGECRGAQIYGDGEVPIQIQARQLSTASSARNVVDYAVSLGANNAMDSLCLHGGGTVVLTLADSGRFRFQDIRFEYP